MTDLIRVGTKRALFTDAREFVSVHVTAGGNGYPAYDAYPGAESARISEQDLLASALLNALIKPLPTYYSLLSIMDELNDRLDHLDHIAGGRAFHELDDQGLRSIAGLYAPIDRPSVKWIGSTTLSKVLHRKRPDLIPITDAQIRECYWRVSSIGKDPKRSYEGYVYVWIAQAQKDLQEQLEQFSQLAELAAHPAITPLRAMDIVGWGMGGGRIPLVP